MDFYCSSWQDFQDTGRSTGAYIFFIQGWPIEHVKHVLVPVPHSSAESEYNTVCATGMDLSYFRMLIRKLLNRDLDIVPEGSPLIILDSKSDVCMNMNGKGTKHTMHVSRRAIFLRNGDK